MSHYPVSLKEVCDSRVQKSSAVVMRDRMESNRNLTCAKRLERISVKELIRLRLSFQEQHEWNYPRYVKLTPFGENKTSVKSKQISKELQNIKHHRRLFSKRSFVIL